MSITQFIQMPDNAPYDLLDVYNAEPFDTVLINGQPLDRGAMNSPALDTLLGVFAAEDMPVVGLITMEDDATLWQVFGASGPKHARRERQNTPVK